MADRCFTEFRLSLEKRVVDLYAECTIGATGAATIVRAKGFKTITRSATGIYDVVLTDKYRRILGVDAVFEHSAGTSGGVYVKTNGITTGILSVVSVDFAGADADPANGSTMHLHLALANSDAM